MGFLLALGINQVMAQSMPGVPALPVTTSLMEPGGFQAEFTAEDGGYEDIGGGTAFPSSADPLDQNVRPLVNLLRVGGGAEDPLGGVTIYDTGETVVVPNSTDVLSGHFAVGVNNFMGLGAYFQADKIGLFTESNTIGLMARASGQDGVGIYSVGETVGTAIAHDSGSGLAANAKIGLFAISSLFEPDGEGDIGGYFTGGNYGLIGKSELMGVYGEGPTFGLAGIGLDPNVWGTAAYGTYGFYASGMGHADSIDVNELDFEAGDLDILAGNFGRDVALPDVPPDLAVEQMMTLAAGAVTTLEPLPLTGATQIDVEAEIATTVPISVTGDLIAQGSYSPAVTFDNSQLMTDKVSFPEGLDVRKKSGAADYVLEVEGDPGDTTDGYLKVPDGHLTATQIGTFYHRKASGTGMRTVGCLLSAHPAAQIVACGGHVLDGGALEYARQNGNVCEAKSSNRDHDGEGLNARVEVYAYCFDPSAAVDPNADPDYNQNSTNPFAYDTDNDGVLNLNDNCEFDWNPDQADDDDDGIGDVCDCTDEDGDGYSIDGGIYCGEVDCDDTNPAIYPGAPEEPCDGIDHDCDGDAQDGVTEILCDGDDQDCDGLADDQIPEICDNEIDDDCDELTDEEDIDDCGVLDCSDGCTGWVTTGDCGDDGCGSQEKPQSRTCQAGYETCSTERCSSFLAVCGGLGPSGCCEIGATYCPYFSGEDTYKSCNVPDPTCPFGQRTWSEEWNDCSCSGLVTFPPAGYGSCRACQCTTDDTCICSYWVSVDCEVIGCDYDWGYSPGFGQSFEPIVAPLDLERLGLPDFTP